jgi:hypothetical protein
VQRIVSRDAQSMRHGSTYGAAMADDDKIIASVFPVKLFKARTDPQNDLGHAFSARRSFLTAKRPKRMHR